MYGDWEKHKYRREARYVPLWNKSRLRRQSELQLNFCYPGTPRWLVRAIRTAQSQAQAKQQKRRAWIQHYRNR